MTDAGRGGNPPQPTLFELVGGQVFFDRLAAEFYRGVRTDPVLLGLYPQPEDLSSAAQRLAMFLAQYWGGPTTYSDERGHPRLRMRHAPYAIDEAMRDRWLAHMNAALDMVTRDNASPATSHGSSLAPEVVAEMRDYFVRAADHLRNM